MDFFTSCLKELIIQCPHAELSAVFAPHKSKRKIWCTPEQDSLKADTLKRVKTRLDLRVEIPRTLESSMELPKNTLKRFEKRFNLKCSNGGVPETEAEIIQIVRLLNNKT